MNTIDTPLYEVFFVEAEGHLIDIRDVVYVGPVTEDCYVLSEEAFSFDVTYKTNSHACVSGEGKEELEVVRSALCEKIKSLYMPFKDESKVVEENEKVTKIDTKKKDKKDDN